MARILAIVALSALSACNGGSTGDPARDAAIANALLGVSAGFANYGASVAARPAFTPSVYCYPVGRGTLCN